MNQIEYREIVINPRVINHLGKDLITTSDVAITELIKNSLDAKAEDIRLHIFDNLAEAYNKNTFKFDIPGEIISFLPDQVKEQTIFVIEDDGFGMDETQLNKGFLEVGTDIKLKEQDITLGEKGIGRLAAQRLGTGLLIETASCKETQGTVTYIDWQQIGNTKNTKSVPSLKIEKVANSYTRLWIFNINIQDFFEVPQQLVLDLGQEMQIPINRELKSAINFLVSPFEKYKKNIISIFSARKEIDSNFNEKMLLLSESTHLFEISLNKDNEITLEYSLELKPWFLERVHRALVKPEAFKRLRKPHRFYTELLDANKERIQAVLTKKIIERELLYLISEFYATIYEKAIANKEARNEYCSKCAKDLLNNLNPIVPINGKIYSFKQNSAIGEHIILESVKEIEEACQNITLKDLKDFLDESNGIKLYRNKYRIGYLGNKESDWLKLQQFRTKGQQWYRFDLGNTVGFVSLTDEKQKYIREISSRLDIIQNKTAESFKVITNIIFNTLFYDLNRSANNILKVIFEEQGLLGESLRKQVKKNLNEITNVAKKNQNVTSRLEEAIELINEKINSNLMEKEVGKKITNIIQETSQHIAEEKKVRQQAAILLNEANEQLKAVEVEAYNNFKLMANGLITETITHELDSVCKTSKSADVTKHFVCIKDYFVSVSEVGVYNEHINPIKISYNAISNKMEDIGNLYNFLEKTFIKKGTYDEFQYQNIFELIKNIEDNFLQLKEQNIEIVCKTDGLEWFVPKGVLVHVFYNLFTNSAFWIDKRRKYAQNDEKYRTNSNDNIVVEKINDSAILVYDTGTGVLKNMEDILFQPLESGKPNNEGRGMGLYIVQQLLRSFSADIQLLDERNKYDNRYKFLLILNDEEN
ncbi:MAG: ATP-binding protein [bacterium]|nr:ATP-binding protein [bacterium]MCM1376170.1 ATP-binding protein [Muribaculum sp.]